MTPSKPLQFVHYTLLGSGLLIASYAASFLPYSPLAEHRGLSAMFWSARWELALSALPFLAGTGLIWSNLRPLTSGIRAERWPETDLEPARRLLALPLFSWILGLCSLASILLVVIMLPAGHHHSSFAYLLIWAVYPIATMKSALRKPLPPGPRTHWTHSAPIYSDHWGHRA